MYAIDSDIIPSQSQIEVLTFTPLLEMLSKLYLRKNHRQRKKLIFDPLKLSANMKGYRFKESTLSEEEYAVSTKNLKTRIKKPISLAF